MVRYLFPPEVLKISSVSVEMFQDALAKIVSVFNFQNYSNYSTEENDKLKGEYETENGAVGNIKRSSLMMVNDHLYSHKI